MGLLALEVRYILSTGLMIILLRLHSMVSIVYRLSTIPVAEFNEAHLIIVDMSCANLGKGTIHG